MKLSICLSGQPRDVKNSLKNIKESWSYDQDVDFFFHSWWGVEGVPFRDDAPSDVYTDDLFDYIITTLNPVHYKIENPIQFEKQYPDSAHWGCYHPRFNRNPSQNIQSMFYSLNESNNFKSFYEVKNNFKYDWVIRSRFDVKLNTTINFNEYNRNIMNVPNGCFDPINGYVDCFAFSNSSNMDIYSGVYNCMDEYLNNLNIKLCGEYILKQHLDTNHIPVTETVWHSLYR
jgi:hypothetical protein